VQRCVIVIRHFQVYFIVFGYQPARLADLRHLLTTLHSSPNTQTINSP
jgi:hypothetical protein